MKKNNNTQVNINNSTTIVYNYTDFSKEVHHYNVLLLMYHTQVVDHKIWNAFTDIDNRGSMMQILKK